MALTFKIRIKTAGGSRSITIPAALAAIDGIEIGDIVMVTIKKAENGSGNKK